MRGNSQHTLPHYLSLQSKKTYDVSSTDPHVHSLPRRKNVSAAEEGDATLHVGHTGVSFINWVTVPDGAFIVTTKSGGSIDDSNVIKRFKGRLRITDNGSLHITNLSLQDTGIYRATIPNTDKGETCILYNLTVYERLSAGYINITHSITSNDTCSLSLLCTVDRRDVLITWSTVHSSDINVTQGVLYVPPSDVSLTYTCTARNPVSTVSKTVIPREYCQTSISNSVDYWRRRYPLFGILVLLPILCLISLIYLMWRNKRSQRKPNSAPYDQVINLYFFSNAKHSESLKVGDIPRQPENAYQTQEEQSCMTVYSEVQHEKKTGNSQKKMDRTAENTKETVYSEVTLPKKTGSSQKKMVGTAANTVETVYCEVTLPQVTQQNGTGAYSVRRSDHSNVTDVKIGMKII
ncbi:SLAM family member 5-like [Eleutherodactylus coqui]|uniref:SLAM family member 5-like n=1 Tax=Eleutherodactylus coqui TaxID=57060 RepID=UPI0034628D5C